MNLEHQRRSTNVEDESSDPMTALIKSLMLRPIDAAQQTWNHPWEQAGEHYSRLYSNQPIPPRTQLGADLGYDQAGHPPPLDMSNADIQGKIVRDPTFLQMMIDEFNPWVNR